MNRNHHMQYRRSIYRKRRIRTTVITIAVVLALLIAIFLILGNILFDKTNEKETEPSNTDTQAQTNDTLPADSVRQIKATSISLNGDIDSISASLDSAKDRGFDSVSVIMNTKDGKLTHYSEIADRLKYSSFNSANVSVSTLMESAKSRSLYVSGVYYVSAFSESDDLTRSVAIAELATVISESLRAGLDEAILVAADISEEQCAEVMHLVSEIRAFVPNATIGFALPDSLVASKNAELIDSLARQVSFLTLDITGYKDSDPIAFTEERVNGMHFSLLRYKMRVIIPFLEDGEKQNALISTVESSGISNWQIAR